MLASAPRTLASSGGVYSISRTNVARVPLASWLFFSTWLPPYGIRRRPNLQSHIHLLRGITCFSATRLLMSIDHVTGWLFRVARNCITDLFGFAMKSFATVVTAVPPDVWRGLCLVVTCSCRSGYAPGAGWALSCHCQVSISDCQLICFAGGQSAIGIGQLAILRPTRYRVVVLTSWDRELECLPRVEPLTNDEKL